MRACWDLYPTVALRMERAAGELEALLPEPDTGEEE
jgi:hypothetical protein